MSAQFDIIASLGLLLKGKSNSDIPTQEVECLLFQPKFISLVYFVKLFYLSTADA